MNIGLDLDDTIVDHEPPLKKLARKYGRAFSHGEACSDVILKTRLSKEEYKHVKKELWEMSACARPIKDSIEIIKKLHENGCKLYIISRRVTESEIGHRWIREYLPYFDQRNVFLLSTIA